MIACLSVRTAYAHLTDNLPIPSGRLRPLLALTELTGGDSATFVTAVLSCFAAEVKMLHQSQAIEKNRLPEVLKGITVSEN